eukprot:TRINITY_DN3576_c0_g2_i1.p1 TRINITY_DN3576_c0_g2~~TRINITY_DN3576_c0_g2_i1.p1  ORF type:complete len:236 (-),score=96.51 TRINITY_DN3576_c0_g2_i1:70-777(-)
MKVTLTQEGLELSKELKQLSLELSQLALPKELSSRQANLTHNSLPTLPKIKGVTEVAVKAPRVRISKDFEARYPRLSATSYFASTERNLANTDSLRCTTETFHPFIQQRLNKALQKTANVEEAAGVEVQFRKLMEKYNIQIKQRKAMEVRIEQRRRQEEMDKTERIEKFLVNFSEMTRKFEEQLLVDTRKVRKKARVQKVYQGKYNPFWSKGRLTELATARRPVKKYVELVPLIK